MELEIIKYSLALLIGMYLYTLPFRLILMLKDSVGNIFSNSKKWYWKNFL